MSRPRTDRPGGVAVWLSAGVHTFAFLLTWLTQVIQPSLLEGGGSFLAVPLRRRIFLHDRLRLVGGLHDQLVRSGEILLRLALDALLQGRGPEPGGLCIRWLP